MSWLWSSDNDSSETADTSPSSSSQPEFTPDPYSSTSSYDFTTPSNHYYDDDDDLDATDTSFTTYAPSSTDDYVDLTSTSLGPRLDFGNLDGINPSTIGLPGYGGGRMYDYDFYELRRKGFGESLTYLGGLSYLTGAAVGGTRGLMEALTASRGKPWKLQVNAILNGMGKRGALLANSMGVLSLMFAVAENGLFNVTREDDAVNYAMAGGIAGMVFKSTRGLKAMGIWGVGGAAVGLGAVWASRQGVYGREVQGLL